MLSINLLSSDFIAELRKKRKKETTIIWRKNHPENVRRWRAKDYKEHKEYYIKSATAYNKVNHDRYIESATKCRYSTRYGITVETCKNILYLQKGACGICNKPIEYLSKSRSDGINVDHDHNTGFVRGLLCYNCNIALGLIKDNRIAVLGLIDYLQHDFCGIPYELGNSRNKRIRPYINHLIDVFGDRCYACGQLFQGGVKRCLDHDHKTMLCRGLLCSGCNFALGHFKDNIHNLYSALGYLQRGGVL